MKPGTWQIWGSAFSSRSIASNYLYHQEVCSIVNLLKKTENLFHSSKTRFDDSSLCSLFSVHKA